MHFALNRLSRRRFLQSTLATGAVALSGGFPAISRAADRPLVTHGVQSGDVGFDQAVLWSRTDRPAEAVFEWATTGYAIFVNGEEVMSDGWNHPFNPPVHRISLGCYPRGESFVGAIYSNIKLRKF